MFIRQQHSVPLNAFRNQPTEKKMPTNLQPLIDSWKHAKEKTDEAKADLLSVENQIIETLGDELKKGTNNFGDLKIVCANSEKWSQEELAIARNSWPKDVEFPFLSEYKPDNKQLKYLKEHNETTYGLLEKALSIAGKKPAFSLKSDKGE